MLLFVNIRIFVMRLSFERQKTKTETRLINPETNEIAILTFSIVHSFHLLMLFCFVLCVVFSPYCSGVTTNTHLYRIRIYPEVFNLDFCLFS